MDTVERIAEMLEKEENKTSETTNNENDVEIITARIDALEKTIASLIDTVNNLTKPTEEKKESEDNEG